jgi:hypothetical protein
MALAKLFSNFLVESSIFGVSRFAQNTLWRGINFVALLPFESTFI